MADGTTLAGNFDISQLLVPKAPQSTGITPLEAFATFAKVVSGQDSGVGNFAKGFAPFLNLAVGKQQAAAEKQAAVDKDNRMFARDLFKQQNQFEMSAQLDTLRTANDMYSASLSDLADMMNGAPPGMEYSPEQQKKIQEAQSTLEWLSSEEAGNMKDSDPGAYAQVLDNFIRQVKSVGLPKPIKIDQFAGGEEAGVTYSADGRVAYSLDEETGEQYIGTRKLDREGRTIGVEWDDSRVKKAQEAKKQKLDAAKFGLRWDPRRNDYVKLPETGNKKSEDTVKKEKARLELLKSRLGEIDDQIKIMTEVVQRETQPVSEGSQLMQTPISLREGKLLGKLQAEKSRLLDELLAVDEEEAQEPATSLSPEAQRMQALMFQLLQNNPGMTFQQAKEALRQQTEGTNAP